MAAASRYENDEGQMPRDFIDNPIWTATSIRKPIVIVVSGRPGSGKTTLARTLALTLACPLIARDDINEGIFHTFAGEPELARKDVIATAAFHTFFSLIGLLVCAHSMVVAEAAFQDHRWRIGLEPILPLADLRIVHCQIDDQLAYSRVISRQPAPSAVMSTLPAAAGGSPGTTQSAKLRPFQPLSLPVPSLHVSTYDGYAPCMEEIVAFAGSR